MVYRTGCGQKVQERQRAMKPPLVLDKSLLHDKGFESHATSLNAQYQFVIPTHVVMEWVTRKDGQEPAAGSMVSLREKLSMLPGTLACPIPAALRRNEVPAPADLLTRCDGELIQQILSGDTAWITTGRIETWRSQVLEGVEQLTAMALVVPKMTPAKKQGEVTDKLLADLAAKKSQIASDIYSGIWRPKLGPKAPETPDVVTAATIQVFFFGAVMWFGRYGLWPSVANPSKVFNEVVDLDIRSLAVAFRGFGCLDQDSQKVFDLLVDDGLLVKW
jgi:hypothetical protein